MAVSLIGSPTTLSAVSAQASTISQDEFLKVLLTQLQFQDPLKPMDNQQFLAQMAQFSSLEQTRQLNDRIDQLLTIQSSSQSIGLIGKTVEVSTSSGSVVGQVTTLGFQDGVPSFTVRTAAGAFLTDISLSQISVVR
ncbi:MAG: flagellar hook capping FlgD N-terminal domain-containing protein [Pseudomonadota bacterium]